MIDSIETLEAFKGIRLPMTSKIVLTNRENPPDT
jgi:hypothetical protein